MQKHKRNSGLKVSPRSTAKIQSEAQSLRDSLGLKKHYLNVCALYEYLQDESFLEFAVLPIDKMDVEARTNPDSEFIEIREDIYDKAVQGDGHCRFTLAHELGHLFLHKGEAPITFSRGESDHETWEDSEWQADTFASELLMDSRLFKDEILNEDLPRLFGVSQMAVKVKFKKMGIKKASKKIRGF